MILGIVLGIFGAVWRRWMGGWLGHRRWIQMVVGGLVTGTYAYYLSDWNIWAYGVGVLFCALITPGHGSYMDMGKSPEDDNERWVSPVLDLFFEDRKSDFARDFTGMLLRYLMATIPIGTYLMLVLNMPGGIYYMALGVIPAIAYAFFWVFKKLPKVGGFLAGATSYGELCLGATLFGGLGVARLPMVLPLPF